jgi:ABC-2 type transport system ATP-binding protein
MIQAEDLSKLFDDFLAVDGVCLSVPAGEILVLLGPNGAGKTTTVRMLTSILRPSRGWARIAGYDVVSQPEQVRASVGVLTEHHGLYARMRSEEYLEFYGGLYGLDRQTCQKRSLALMDQFGLADARKKRLGEFSKGMRQKLALVRALLHEPPVLLLDEPTSAMDPESARMVRDSIIRLRSADRAVIFCTHNLDEAEELADQVAIIRHGRIVVSGQKEALKRAILGPQEYEARLSGPAPEKLDALPQFAALSASSDGRLRFKLQDPAHDNPDLLRWLLGNGFEVITYEAVPQNLEEVYMQAMQQAEHDR